MTFEEMVTSDARGIIVVCNLLDTEASGLIDRSLIADFIGVWRDVYDVLKKRDPADLFEQLLSALTEIVDPDALRDTFGIESTQDYRFLMQATLPAQSLSTVKTTEFIEFILDQKSWEYFDKEGIAYPYSSGVPNGEYQAMKLQELAADETRFLAGISGLGDRPLWVTMTGQLERGLEGREHTELGDRVRDLVGLVHRSKGEVVVRVDLPDDSLRARRFARPTLFDGVGPRFTSVPRDPPQDEAPGWGWTFQLEALYDPGVRAAGVPESLCDCDPVSGFAGREFSFKPLGVLRIPRKDEIGRDDDLFASYLMNERTRDDLMAALRALR